MQKHEIEISGHKITQLSETTFEGENQKQNLDFYFEINDEDEVDVFVFDSEIRYSGAGANIEPCLDYFQCETIAEAVTDAMAWFL